MNGNPMNPGTALPGRVSGPSAASDQRILELIEANKIPRPDHDALANIYRRRGDLAAAASEYARLHARGNPAPAVALFHAMFQQQRVPPRLPQTGFAPAPFVLWQNLLDGPSNQAMFDEVIARQESFRPTELSKLDPYGKQGRANLVNYDTGRSGVLMRTLVEQQLAHLCERLNMPVFTLDLFHLKFASYLHGDFFHAHQDNGSNNPDRRISFVYYFNREPKPFSGGDLILYDSRFAPRAYVRSQYTRIIPQNNSMIFFPSEYFHEVLPIESQNRAFMDSRFTMAGHIG